jgi:3-phosphoshikimate 1-carboxyvinyltransferase
MTLDAVNSFGISAEWTEEAVICIKGNQFYSSRNSVVEGDYSNAAFFEAMNCLGSDIRIEVTAKS